jgi:hypothetical protein
MKRTQRLKYEMFGRVGHFGVANRDVFPTESAAGKKFDRLAAMVKAIEDQLVHQGRARAEARKLKVSTRRGAMAFMKSVASAGRRASTADLGPHPFRLPQRRAAAVVLATARLFVEEAERRKAQFAELGLPPTFLTDFTKSVDDLATAVSLQQDSRSARHKAQGSIDGALEEGMGIVADLDVTVPATLRDDPGRLAAWFGARRMDQPGDANADAPKVDAPTSRPLPDDGSKVAA